MSQTKPVEQPLHSVMEPTGAECKTGPSSLEISDVPPNLVRAVWDMQLPMIEKGLAGGHGNPISSHSMLAAILDGKMSLWAVHRGPEIVAVVVLSLLQGRKKKLFIELIAGNGMDTWADKVEQLLLNCKQLLGADSIEASCRVGLARFLQRRGWRQKAIVMEL